MPEHCLDSLLDDLDRAHADYGFDIPGELIGVSDAPSAACAKGQIGFLPLDCEHPSERLIGFTAPEDWWAIGLVMGGWAGPLDGADAYSSGTGVPISAHPDATRIRMIMLVGRDGRCLSRAHCADGRTLHDASEGYLPDLLRRTMGLPTAPPAASTAQLLTAMWLCEVDAVIAEAKGRGHRPSWARLARLHPALRLLAVEGHRAGSPDALVPAARALGRVLTWARVHEQCRQGWLADVVSVDAARWMDEGMLSRYVLSGLPPIGVLIRRIRPALRVEVADRLADALRALDVDPMTGSCDCRG